MRLPHLFLSIVTLTSAGCAPLEVPIARGSDVLLNGAVALSPDGEVVAAGGDDGRVTLARTSDAEVLATLGPGFATDEAGRAELGSDVAMNVGASVTVSGVDVGPIRALAFSPSGDRLALASERQVVVVDQPGGAVRWRVAGIDLLGDVAVDVAPTIIGGVTALAFSPDASLLAVALGNGRGIQLRRADSGELVRTLPTRSPAPWRLAFSADGARLLTTTLSHTVEVSPVDGSAEPLVLKPETLALHAGAFSPDGKEVLALVPLLYQAGEPRMALRAWGLEDGAPREGWTVTGVNSNEGAFAPDVRRFVVDDRESGDVQVRAVRDGALLATLGSRGRTKQLVWSANGRRVAAIGLDGDVRWWEVPD